MSATKSLKKPLQSLINSELEKLQLEIKLLKKERDAYKGMLQQRIENEPKKISFWQDIKNNFSQITTDIKNAFKVNLQEFKKNSEKQKYTNSLLKLFHAKNKNNTYEGKDYQITHKNGIYTVNSIEDNRQVMQFRSDRTGTKFITYNPNQKDIQALQSLRNYVKTIPQTTQHDVTPTSFQEFGKSGSQRLTAINQIADTLSEYAKFKGHPVSIQGKKSNYDWQADLRGNVTIIDKHKDEVIFQRNNGKIYDAMGSRDITFFQNSLPALKQSIKTKHNIQNSNEINYHQDKQLSNNLLTRITNTIETIHNITQIIKQPLKIKSEHYYAKSDKDNIKITRKKDNKLIFNYNHNLQKITHNSMTEKDLSYIEKDLAKIPLTQKQKTHQRSNDKGLDLE